MFIISRDSYIGTYYNKHLKKKSKNCSDLYYSYYIYLYSKRGLNSRNNKKIQVPTLRNKHMYTNCSEVQAWVLVGETHYTSNCKINKIVIGKERYHKAIKGVKFLD